MGGNEVLDLTDALDEGFPQTTAEKVHRLLGVLRELQSLNSTRGRFTLKGGTALNIFHSTAIPRLSVDLDLMATGFPEAAAGTPGHHRVVKLVGGSLKTLGYRITMDQSPAAATLYCGYRNSLGSTDRIKVDLDILNRMTLLPAHNLPGPALFRADDLSFPVVDPAELLGQKLVAVAYRHHPRDLYDMFQMLRQKWHQRARARASYLAYSFLQDQEWHRLDYPTRLDIEYRPALLREVLRADQSPPTLEQVRDSAREALMGSTPPYTLATADEQVLRDEILRGNPDAFADLSGENDPERRRMLALHPGLAWRLRQAGGAL